MKKKGGNVPFELRECPAPPDDSQKLITHKIDPETCASRQSCHYHKCFCCKWRGMGVQAEKTMAAGKP